MKTGFEIIDISQPVGASTACFPGDVAFSRQITMDYEQSGIINLSAFTMSPHVGTHTDAPIHIQGHMEHPNTHNQTIGQVSLSPYVGPAAMVDVSPWNEAITWAHVENQLSAWSEFPPRVLFKTRTQNDSNHFQPPYAWPEPSLIAELAARGVVLVGIDTPSMDHVDSKTLETHHALLEAGLASLENLDLTQVPEQNPVQELPFLIALPLKLMEVEASPVRAILLMNREHT